MSALVAMINGARATLAVLIPVIAVNVITTTMAVERAKALKWGEARRCGVLEFVGGSFFFFSLRLTCSSR